jgi:endoglucanase
MKTTNIFLIFLVFPVLISCKKTNSEPSSQSHWATAIEMNQRLGRGINIGNTFEADQLWQSPFDADDFRKIAELGFTHVRVPIKWERDDRSMSTSPYTIYPEFLETVKSVVDTALKNKLHIIINMHHHNDLMADPQGQKVRFLSQWKQISEYFKDYPDSLLFEILNEPHDKLTAVLWNDYYRDALRVIRETNPHRCVLVGVAEWGGTSALKSLTIVPGDNHLILTIHYYNPFQFTHQGAEWVDGSDAWLGTKWNDTQAERQAIIDEFQNGIALSKSKNIPIHIGEFGAYSKADMESRVKWTRFLSRWFEQQEFSWAYWEWNSGFGIYDPQTKIYKTELINALIKEAIPPVQTVN